MAQQYVVTGVEGPSEWSGQYGPMLDYKLTLEGQDKAAVVTQKPTSPAPQQGQQVWLELQQHPKFADLLKARRVPPPDQQQSFAPRQNGSPSVTHDDPTRRSIEAQTALKAAVEYHAKDDKAPIDVVQTAAIFADWLGQRS